MSGDYVGGAVSPSAPSPSVTYRAAARAALAVMDLQCWQFDIRGARHLPATGGAVIAANHIGFWDFFTVARHPYLHGGRPVRILAKESLFHLPLVGSVMRRAEHIPVRRGAGAAAYRHAVAALRRGELVLVLPEQTISPSFELLPFKAGAARMAIAARVPLIPAISWGSHRCHTAGLWPRPAGRLPVSVSYGAPLEPDATSDARQLTEQLRERMQRMLEDVQQRYVGGSPAGAWWVPARLGGAAPTVAEALAHVRRVTQRWRPAS